MRTEEIHYMKVIQNVYDDMCIMERIHLRIATFFHKEFPVMYYTHVDKFNYSVVFDTPIGFRIMDSIFYPSQ